MRLLLLPLLLTVTASAVADTYEEGLEGRCDSFQMRVRDFDFANGEPVQKQNARTTIYRTGDGSIHLSCLINKHKIEVNLEVHDSQRCSRGSPVTVMIDGETVIKNAEVHGCPVGITEIAVEASSSEIVGGYVFEVCGYTAQGFFPEFKGCVRITAKQLATLKKPLSSPSPMGELIKLVRFSYP